MLQTMNRRRGHLLTLLTGLALVGCSSDDGGRGNGDDGGGVTGADDGGTGTGGGSGTGGGDDGTGGGSDDGGSSGGTGGTGDDGGSSGGTGSGTTDDGGTSGDGGTTSDGGTTDSGSSQSLVPCDTASATLEPIPPNIHLVLDKSGSMASNTWDHDNQPATPEVTRWYSLHEVVDFVVTNFEANINFGAVLFPSVNAQPVWGPAACIVEAAPDVLVGPNNATAILDAIPDKTAVSPDIAGGTPAAGGLTLAYDDLNAQGGDNAPAVIFVTDGAANCGAGMTGNDIFEVYDDDLLPLVTGAWSTDAIPTYVVGIGIENATTPNNIDGQPDGINPYDKLDELAPAGGKPNPGGPPAFYETNNQIELEAALQQIIDDSMSCIVELDPLPPFPEDIKVFVGGVEIPEITDCATEDGWMYVPPFPPHDTIELCGTACTELKATGEVYIEYYCEPA
jgi:hypothetical protein